ncbi:MAG: ligase-associated DNA damage response endonuclease PdeM [Bacteroidetes bacterium]|nr:ligase-associated DNA damage response endonuclease PdeM [Bacteroidota bacterium]
MEANEIQWEFAGEKLTLLPEKALYLPEKNALLLSDLHLGKTQHFRKNGLAIPASAAQNDLLRFKKLIGRYPAADVYFLGDLFHSETNNEMEAFYSLLDQESHRRFSLIPGNHDVALNQSPTLHITEKCHPLGNLILCHNPADLNKAEAGICGHIHPGFRLKGQGRQSLLLPAFFRYEQLILLPAFGKLTGLIPADEKGLQEVGLIMPGGIRTLSIRQ